MKYTILVLVMASVISCHQKNASGSLSDQDQQLFAKAEANGVQANLGFIHCERYLHAWLQYRDPDSGLIPRNLNESRDFWNARDAAADNYPFMVLTSFFVDSAHFNNTMINMLKSEKQLTSRVRSLPDTYSFSKKTFLTDSIKMDEIAYGTAEYVKDGILPLTEWLGQSPWSDRMIEMLKDLHQEIDIAGVVGAKGFGHASREEVNGELLQALSRIYWMTGDDEFLEWAIKIGDYYLLDVNHPTRDLTYLRLRDHGCELISGLCELYATVNTARPDKKQAYQKPLVEMLDRILEVGRNEDGLFYDGINPQTGEVVHNRIADTWGYTLNGFYTVYLVDGNEAYRDAILKIFSNLHKYKNYDWENGSADGYADAIESALNLYNRIPHAEVADWIDSEIHVMWSKQKENGIIEGWHGDGNFARTTIMYNLWKSKGLFIQPWRNDVIVGAEQKGDSILISVRSDKPWSGKLYFDHKRFKDNLKLPMDWPRINQFPQWFDAVSDHQYTLLQVPQNEKTIVTGELLKSGIEIKVTGERKLVVY